MHSWCGVMLMPATYIAHHSLLTGNGTSVNILLQPFTSIRYYLLLLCKSTQHSHCKGIMTLYLYNTIAFMHQFHLFVQTHIGIILQIDCGRNAVQNLV